jgi:hypothetical protein
MQFAPTCCVYALTVVQVLDPGGRRVSPQLALFEELVVRAYLAVSDMLLLRQLVQQISCFDVANATWCSGACMLM